MWNLSVPWWEFVLRGVVVYLFLLVFLRLTGKRQTGQYAPFDLVLLLILSNAVQNSMNAGDNSLIGGLISASTLISCHVALSHLTYRFRRLERLIDGCPRVLVQDGKVDEILMQSERISPSDLAAALRAGGCLHAHEVARATIEVNGQITVVLRPAPPFARSVINRAQADRRGHRPSRRRPAAVFTSGPKTPSRRHSQARGA